MGRGQGLRQLRHGVGAHQHSHHQSDAAPGSHHAHQPAHPHVLLRIQGDDGQAAVDEIHPAGCLRRIRQPTGAGGAGKSSPWGRGRPGVGPRAQRQEGAERGGVPTRAAGTGSHLVPTRLGSGWDPVQNPGRRGFRLPREGAQWPLFGWGEEEWVGPTAPKQKPTGGPFPWTNPSDTRAPDRRSFPPEIDAPNRGSGGVGGRGGSHPRPRRDYPQP